MVTIEDTMKNVIEDTIKERYRGCYRGRNAIEVSVEDAIDYTSKIAIENASGYTINDALTVLLLIIDEAIDDVTYSTVTYSTASFLCM